MALPHEPVSDNRHVEHFVLVCHIVTEAPQLYGRGIKGEFQWIIKELLKGI